MKRKIFYNLPAGYLILSSLLILLLCVACDETDGTLAPYAGTRMVSDITIEHGSFTPKLTWIGGYVSVIGVNKGETAALDSTLIWLAYSPDNSLKFPVQFGQLPSGANDLTAEYGGLPVSELIEDSSYTFWIMKDDAWQELSDEQGKKIFIDTSATGSSVTITADTIYVGPAVYTQAFTNLDVYINLENVRSVGKLATIFAEQPRTSNHPLITWEIKQSGVTDSLISALGIVEGQSYNPQKLLWEVFSVDSTTGNKVYGKNNVIMSPVITGNTFPDTHVFVPYPAEGLERNKDYYIWIANKDWDGEGRLRVTDYYAYITFHTW